MGISHLTSLCIKNSDAACCIGKRKKQSVSAFTKSRSFNPLSMEIYLLLSCRTQ